MFFLPRMAIDWSCVIYIHLFTWKPPDKNILTASESFQDPLNSPVKWVIVHLDCCEPCPGIMESEPTFFWFVFVDTLQGTNISHLGKRKIIFKMPFWGDMLVSWRVGGQTVGLRLRQLCGREVLPTFFFGTPKKSWQPLWKKKRFGQWWVPTNSFWIHVISSF